MAVVRHFRFCKIQILTACRAKSAILRQHAKFHEYQSSRCRDMSIYRFFAKWRPPLPVAIHLTHMGATYEEYFVVFVIVQSLVGTNAVLSII